MPASFDFGASPAITHNPAQRLDPTLPRLPKFSPQQVFDGWIKGIKDATGIDLTALGSILSGKWNLIDGLQGAVSTVQSVIVGIQSAIATLQDKVENIPVLGDFFEIVTGKPDSDPNDAASWIRNAFDSIGKAAQGASNPAAGDSFLSGIFNAITGVRTTATTAQSTANAASTTAGSAQTAASNASSAASNALTLGQQIAQNAWNTWFGGTSATGTPAEVEQTIAAIKQAVIGGYTVDTFTTNGTWTKPANLLEWYGIVIGGGGKAMPGTTSSTNADVRLGGVEGSSGGYVAQQIAPADVPASLSVTVGPAATTNGTNGGITSVGSLVASSPNGSGISTLAGFTPAASTPGKGGAGGQATGAAGSAGQAGGSTPLATGGAGGAGKTGGSGTATAGTAGAAASLTGPTKAGGGGGGGGGGNGSTGSGTKTGGNGGNGGYPGGGSGGGGAAVGGGTLGSSQVAGVPGNAPNGVAFIIYKAG